MKYVAIPSQAVTTVPTWDGWHPQVLSGENVIETEKSPVRTGLLDSNGIPLYRVPETVRFGFQSNKK